MQTLETPWFKNEDEEKALKAIIRDASYGRSKEIEDEVIEQNKHFTDQIDHIYKVIAKIDDTLEPSVELSSENNFSALSIELTEALDELSVQFETYTKTHPTIKTAIDTFFNASQNLQKIIRNAEGKEVTSKVTEEYISQRVAFRNTVREVLAHLDEGEDIVKQN